MNSSDLKQRLAAILAADVTGYSRLMAADDRATVTALDAARAVFRAQIETNQGRVIDMAGDSVMAVFETATGAVLAALAIQTELKARIADVSEDRRMRFRIGIHLGDIIEKSDGTIYGDGVNIAARLEGLAEPGGIAVSASIRTAVKGKVDATFEDRGEQTVKNIAEPVQCFRVRFHPEDAGAMSDTPTAAPAHAATSEANVPTVVVLPFKFNGNAGEHEYIAEALTVSIGSALAHFREYKIVEGADAHHATFVLSGTLQLAGSRIRIAPQLSTKDGGRKLWAEKFDRNLADVFELQDEISAIVAAYLGEAIWQETARSLADKSKDDFSAMDWSYYAMDHIHRLTKEDLLESKKALENAIRMSPGLLYPRATLAFVLMLELSFGFASDVDSQRAEALAMTEELLRKDPANANVHKLASRLDALLNRHAESLTHSERAVALNPYDGDLMLTYAMALNLAGRSDEAIGWVEKALRYNPQPPDYYRQWLMAIHFWAGNPVSALASLRRVEGALLPAMHYVAIAVLQINGAHDEAGSKIKALLEAQPDSCVEYARGLFAGYEMHLPLDLLLDTLRDAGLPA
ncbi:MAG: adenylate/guanylate cyclase domain-containing protein [Burkholderiaceae bacterium]